MRIACHHRNESDRCPSLRKCWERAAMDSRDPPRTRAGGACNAHQSGTEDPKTQLVAPMAHPDSNRTDRCEHCRGGQPDSNRDPQRQGSSEPRTAGRHKQSQVSRFAGHQRSG
jgi:hypothetical protein